MIYPVIVFLIFIIANLGVQIPAALRAKFEAEEAERVSRECRENNEAIWEHLRTWNK